MNHNFMEDAARKKNWMAITGLVLGIIGFGPCVIPFCGIPTSIVGLVFSIMGLQSKKRGLSIVGIILNGIWLVLTVVNAAIGAYLGATGQHDFINRFFQ